MVTLTNSTEQNKFLFRRLLSIRDSHKDRLELPQASCKRTFRGQIKQSTNCQEHTDLASNIDVLIRLHKMLCC